jgi:hypothetical protein
MPAGREGVLDRVDGPALLLLGHRETASEGTDGCPIRVLRAADAAQDKINGLDEPIRRV